MNVIERLKDMLSDCPLMDDFNDGHVDYTEAEPGNFGIFNVGTTKLKEDVLGNATYISNFTLYANNMAYDDMTRLANSSWLLDMSYWLNNQKDLDIEVEIEGETKKGVISKIDSSNAMMFRYPTGNPADGVDYQIQIKVTYKILEEE